MTVVAFALGLILREYNEALVRKLEDKMLELDQTNRVLSDEVAERRLSESRLAQQARLLDMAGDAVVCIGSDGVLGYWNRGAERVFGRSAARASVVPGTSTTAGEPAARCISQPRPATRNRIAHRPWP